jgi:2-haloacid dehalogenase
VNPSAASESDLDQTEQRQVANGIEVVLCDVFGTVVDWRGSIIRQLETLSNRRGWEIDAPHFADEWRSQYGPSMDKVLTGKVPWTSLDVLHRLSLQALLEEHSITASHEDIDAMVKFWHRLDAWPDAPNGIRRLKRRFIVGTMSNGNVALLTNVAKHADLDWDVILSAELARLYKRDLDCYRYNVALLDRPLSRVMMVAAHPGELDAVSHMGMKTAFVHRPNEFGDHGQSLPPDQHVDLACDGLDELATALGV